MAAVVDAEDVVDAVAVVMEVRFLLTLRRPSRRKLRMRWFFDISKVKESSFFESDLTDPLSDF